VQDPEIFLTGLALEIPSVMDERRKAVLDVAHRSFVNHETFFFADEEEKRRFDADPVRYCGIVTDPVTKQRFRPGADSPRVDHAGRPYFFYTQASLETFRGMPGMYAQPSLEMIQDQAAPAAEKPAS
jgi:YHS domain-containing protein